jgi:FkbM family methyltransferase
MHIFCPWGEVTTKILWHSVAPWAPTGYGQQTGIFTPRIRDLGHDVALSIYYGHQGSEIRWNGLRCLPAYSANYGTDVLMQHALTHFDAADDPTLADASCKGLIVVLGDCWTFEVPLLNEMSVAAWVPVDHLTLPDVTRRWFGVMGAVPIAMSRFGERLLTDAGFVPEYVPHGIDLGVFHPGDQAEAREATSIPSDAFVVGMVANNVGRDGSRKAFTEQIAAFAELRRKHSDAFMVIHTDVDQPIGVRLRPFLERTLPNGSYTYSDQYAYRRGMPPAAIAQIYRSLDLFTNCSYGEGFGIPIVEAQACGVPVCVTDATAMPELCGAGWKVGYERVWHDSQGAWTSVPHIGDIADAYELAYEHARDTDLRAQAWAFAHAYDADQVTEQYWKPVLDRFAAALEGRRADLAVRGALAPRQRPPRTREADGLLWLDRGPGSGDALGFADHEAPLRPILAGLLPDGGVLLDVGAHVGHWTLRLASKASRVVAVEANPATAATLQLHLALNDITNVTVVQLAAWDKQARLRLHDPNDQIEGGSTRVLAAENGDGTVPAGRLDQLPELIGIGRLDLVKLDVEGADLHALRGMAGLLERHRPVLFIEDHSVYGYFERADLETTLVDLGYTFEVAHSVPTQWMPDGPSDVVRMADYLVCRPVMVGATKEEP